MNQMSQITIPLKNLFAPEAAPEMNNANPMVLAMQVARRYSFLSLPVFMEIEGDRIILKHPGTSDHTQAEAERLASRAAKHAGNGDCHRAIAIWQRVLQLVPADLVARRDIGMACSELGDFAKAKHYLSEALLIDADDIGSLVALATIAVKQNDYATAEVYARKAVAAEPQDAWALNCLGAVLFHTQRQEEARDLFRAAMASAPELASPYVSIAFLYQQQGRYSAAEATLRDMFTKAKKHDIRSEAIFSQARQSYARVQHSLAESQHEQARRTVEGFRGEVERQTGYPIRLVQTSLGDGSSGQVQFAWQHQRDHHLIQCQPDYPACLLPHLLAHEIMHIRLAFNARQAGRGRIFFLSADHRQTALSAFEGRFQRLARQGFPVDRPEEWVDSLAGNLFAALQNVPLDLVVEQNLREEMPAIAPAQFLAWTSLQEEADDNYQLISRLMPPRFLRALVALHGARLLFADSLCREDTDCAAVWRHREGFQLAKNLWQHWQTKSGALQPGDEYDLVDEFADILELRGTYQWLPDPASNSTPTTPIPA